MTSILIKKFSFLNRTGFYYFIVFLLFDLLFNPVKAHEQRLGWLGHLGSAYPRLLRQGAASYGPARLWRTKQYYALAIKHIPMLVQSGEIKDPAPMIAHSHAMVGFSYYYLFQSAEAMDHYLAAVKYKKDSAAYYFNLGLIYYNQMDFPSAIEYFHQAVKLSADQEIARQGRKFQILSYEAVGDYASILTLAGSAILGDKNADHVFYYYYAGKASAKTGNYSGAVGLLEQCIKLAPWHADAYHELAFSFKRLNQPESAAQMTRQAVANQSAPQFRKYQDDVSTQPLLFL